MSFFLDSGGANSQIQNGDFFHTIFHPLPDSYGDWHSTIYSTFVSYFVNDYLFIKCFVVTNDASTPTKSTLVLFTYTALSNMDTHHSVH